MRSIIITLLSICSVFHAVQLSDTPTADITYKKESLHHTNTNRDTVYFWDFETGEQGWTHTSGQAFPGAWDVVWSGYTVSSYTIAPPDAGDSSFCIDGNFGGVCHDTAMSPVVDNPGFTYFKWGTHFQQYVSYQTFTVIMRTFSSGAWNPWIDVCTYSVDTPPRYDSVDISATVSDSVQVGFVYDQPHATSAWFAAFDNVGLYADTEYHDVGVTRILSPPEGGIPPGDYDWIVRIQNLGDYTETFDVVAEIYDTVGMVQLFYQPYTLTDFPAGGDTALHYNITIVVPNYYYCEVIAQIVDDNPANNMRTVNSFVPESLGQYIYWIDAQTPTSSMVLHGVEFDGTYFYLTGATAINETKVFVFDTLGNLIWTVDQPTHCTGWGWRDMAFDRAYVGPDRIDTLYASCDINIDRFGISKTSGTLDYYGPLPGPINPSRPLAYQPDSLYFYTADQDFIYKFIKNGAFVFSVPAPCLMFGATYDNDSIGGDRLWWSTTDTLNQQFRQFNPNTMMFTGRSFGCDYPSSGLGFAQDFRDMDVLFAIVNEPQADFIYGFFLRWSDSTKVEETKPGDYPLTFGFTRNTPSLGRHTANFTYNLPTSCEVSLHIYDCAGRLVKTIIEHHQTTGTYTAQWNGRDDLNRKATSGIYFAKLEGENKADIRKLILLQ